MKGLIIDEGEKRYSYFSEIFQEIPILAKNYNWLITNIECNPQNRKTWKKLNRKYCWLSGTELAEILREENFQWIWGVLSGFKKNVELEDIMKSRLPYADGYEGFWISPITIQHPLADIEIVAWDSTCSLFISTNDVVINEIRNIYPQSKNLEEYNIN